ncbi:MAG: mechanosensitive ion channel protein MscS [Opitutaceae bacterium]|jgi:small-conductance mechanosensitive channel|nr:mechanosensitive ion channel protein MscS [Opitutaceae bacterium]|tara:strand:+ start:885 stop:1781 length:897 start_codon:yes stop_codon:yes gene_type:complete
MNEFLQTAHSWLTEKLFSIGNTDVSLHGIAATILLVLCIVLGEKIFRLVIVRRLLENTQLDKPVRYGVERIMGYLFLLLGGYIALQTIGLDLSSLTVIAGAVGVGIGFGLQNIISNFISGIIILIERPISIGDRVEVGGVAGQIVKISLRSTIVVTNDNISIIVPNSSFISETVINWSHGDPKARFRIPIGVAYGTDTDKLTEVLLAVAKADPNVLEDPEPKVFFDSYGDSSLNFELGVWSQAMVRSPRSLRSGINFAVYKALDEAGIEIPFPQRDLHVRSGSLEARQASEGDSNKPS